MKKGLFFSFIFFVFITLNISFAECQHTFEIEDLQYGVHNTKCTKCGLKEVHNPSGKWTYDDLGENHIFKCDVAGCLYEYNDSHIGGNHENNGKCSVCGAIYQTHGLDVENIKTDDTYHWYKCSYKDCDFVYEKEEHLETIYVESDLTYHWYRCVLTDCPYRFESQKHYGGSSNNGYCEYELCNKLYVAKLQINEYEYAEYKVGDKDTLVAKFIPEGIEIPESKEGYKWKSSMPNVVKIDNDGNIETLREGIAVVSVTYGEYEASCVVVGGDLSFEVKPTEYTLEVNEQAEGEINVTYKEKNKTININEYVDFSAFRWDKDILKVNIKKGSENKILFKAINASEDPVEVNIWLNNKLECIKDKIEESLKKNIVKYSKEELEYLKQKIDNKEKTYSETELNEFDKKIQYEEIDIQKELYRIKKVIKIIIYISVPEQTLSPSISTSPSEGTNTNGGTSSPNTSGSTNSGGTSSPSTSGSTSSGGTSSPSTSGSTSSGGTSSPSTSGGTSPGVTPSPTPSSSGSTNIEGPSHSPEAPVDGNSGAVVNRRHVCSYGEYFPDPENPESGHLKRCYYTECEYYTKGIAGTKAEHRYKHNDDKDVDMCIICYYEKGSGQTEPQKIHSRDFGIDILQSQFFVVKDETTEIDVIITGVEKDLAIQYGSVYDNNLKWTDGRKDNNCITLKWDVKDEYAREAFDIKFEKRDDERIITVELKDGYMQPTRTEMDVTVENNFGEKRLETIELIKEAPERAQFVLRFTSDVFNSIKVGETKDITIYCKSLYGYGKSDRQEVQDYYNSKNLVKYEDIQVTWESSGGITASGASTPDSKGYIKGQVTGVSTSGNEVAQLIITATAKYENEDLVDEIERELKRGIYVYELDSTSTSGGSYGGSSGGGSGNSSGNNGGGNSSSKGNALPVAAVSVGLLAIAGVGLAVNKMTKR